MNSYPSPTVMAANSSKKQDPTAHAPVLKLKLSHHQKTYKEELLANLRDGEINNGDILDIYHPEQKLYHNRIYPHLLIQVPHSLSKEDTRVPKDTISIEQSIAVQFGLQKFQYVHVKKVEPERVSLQLLELTFKDQYLNRSDMWRLTENLVGCVVYKHKTVEFCNQTVRCQVYEMWTHGSRVSCGYVSEDTKVVYRSSTSRFYIFIQMSSEMWEFDHYGDLYFEKAVSGFLTDMFEMWKKMNTNHEVTIVLFSRSFYPTAQSIRQFPVDMRPCIQQDNLGRFFQDFYRVAVQNERHDDWSTVLKTLRQLFYHYPSAVLGRETMDGETLPDVRDTHARRVQRKSPGKKRKSQERRAGKSKSPANLRKTEKIKGKFGEPIVAAAQSGAGQPKSPGNRRKSEERITATAQSGAGHMKSPGNQRKSDETKRKFGERITAAAAQSGDGQSKGPIFKMKSEEHISSTQSSSAQHSSSNVVKSEECDAGIAQSGTSHRRSPAHRGKSGERFPGTTPSSGAIPTRGHPGIHIRLADSRRRNSRGSHRRQGLKHFPPNYTPTKPPRAELSTADEGNFLEVLNMSLNVFEKHYQDRSLERTGQMSVVITPGVGVFNVDRALMNITKQRIIDNGVGSDLVCLGEQPLHAVPLLKFEQRRGGMVDYSMPGSWINLSFYASPKRLKRPSVDEMYIPRVKVPEHLMPSFYPPAKKRSIDVLLGETRPRTSPHNISNLLDPLQPTPPTKDRKSFVSNTLTAQYMLQLKWGLKNSADGVRTAATTAATADGTSKIQPKSYAPKGGKQVLASQVNLLNYMLPDDCDRIMDCYDAGVFNLPSRVYCQQEQQQQQQPSRRRRRPRHKSSLSFTEVSLTRQSSDPDMCGGYDLASSLSRSRTTSRSKKKNPNSKLHSHFFGALNLEVADRDSSSSDYRSSSPSQGEMAGGASRVPRLPLPLINPFDPKYSTIKMTSYRRRWVHIFPKNISGALIQQHHKEDAALKKDLTTYPSSDDEEENSPDKSAGGRQDDVRSAKAGSPRPVSQTPSRSRRQSERSTDANTLVWGATGEQEWSAAITTGVDWKSLTLPACLPITTDFFPTEETFQREYVLNNYSLLPDDINEGAQSDFSTLHSQQQPPQRTLYGRGPMTTQQVFNELISQRLSQGFQLILPVDADIDSAKPKKKPLIRTPSSSDTNEPSTDDGWQPCVPRESHRDVFGSSQQQLPVKEFKLSIGTLFHRLELIGDNRIEASIYRPRTVPEPLKKDYRYRFCAPYMTGYDMSSTKFKTERLDCYKWNYLDNYVSLYSDSYENPLIEDLKYWQVRIVVVPDLHRSVTRHLMENWRDFPDAAVYGPPTAPQQQTVIEGFLKFMENVHHIKRPVIRRSRTTLVSSSSTSMRERLGSNRITEKPEVLVRSGTVCRTGVSGSIGGGGSATPVDGGSAMGSSSPDTTSSSSIQSGINNNALTQQSPTADIVAAMRQPNTGLNFFSPPHPKLPQYCFLSVDAVNWAKEHVQGISSHTDAMTLLQRLCSDGLMRHASGNKHTKVHYGFFIYFFVTGNSEHDATASPNTYRQLFHEVEIQPLEDIRIGGSPVSLSSLSSPTHSKTLPQCSPSSATDDSTNSRAAQSLPNFLKPELPPLQVPFKTTAAGGRVLSQGPVSIDTSHRSDRSEWGDLVCSTAFSTDTAYLFCLRWMCATGALVTELVSMWQRRAQACNLYLFPIPSDPFALPHSLDCDPLRGPLHLPLNMTCNPPCNSSAGGGILHGAAGTDAANAEDSTAIEEAEPSTLESTDAAAKAANETRVKDSSAAGGANKGHFPSAHESKNAAIKSPTGTSATAHFCLVHDIFSKFPAYSRPQRTRLLQEAILRQFGFVRFVNELSCFGGAGGNDCNQFVHVTGNVFVMILTPGMADVLTPQHYQPPPHTPQHFVAGCSRSASPAPGSVPVPRPSCLQLPEADVEGGLWGVSSSVASPHEEYFHRLMADHLQRSTPTHAPATPATPTTSAHHQPHQQSPGFLWSFNYMLTRRWKSAASGEEATGELLLHDFRNFCANKNDRLRKFCDRFVPPANETSDCSDAVAAAEQQSSDVISSRKASDN